MKKRISKACAFVFVGVIVMMCLCTSVLADTDGTEPKVTLQPDKLVLQLGTRWAGVEFELRTDAGMFPVPVVVDDKGILSMDLGGSTTYTLTCMNSSVPIPDPGPARTPALEPPVPTESTQPTDPLSEAPAQSEPPQQGSGEIPPFAIGMLVIGLAAGAGGLVALFLSKRQQNVYDEWEDENDV